MNRSFSLAKVLEPLGKSAGDLRTAEDIARQTIMKSAVSGFEHGDLAGSYVDYVGGVFLNALLQGSGVFAKIRELAPKGKFHDRLFSPSSTPGATIVGENGSIPVGAYSLGGSTLLPVKAESIAVGSKEALQHQEGLDWLASEMLKNMTLAIDTKVCSILRAACTPRVCSFDPVTDLQILAAVVINTGVSAPLLIVSPAIARLLTFWTNGASYPFFPKMTVVGGEIGGIPVVVTAGQVADEMALIDCSGLITDSGDMQISTSENVMLEMDTAPTGASDNPTGASGELISAFQCEAVGVKSVLTFALSVLRSSAVAVISSIDYGSSI